MAKFKDFGAGSQDEGTKEPISFKIHDEEFFGVKEIQGKLLLDLISKSNNEDAVVSAQIITDFFSQVLTDESYKRFEKLVQDKDRIVSVNTLAEIVGWLIEQYSDRPEEQPENS